MTRKQKICCRALTFLFVLLSVWWVFYIPNGPRTVLKPILPNATFVSVHDRAAGRWDALVSNPVAELILEFTEVPQEVLGGITDSEATKWLDRLAGDRFAVAHVRNLRYVRADAILFSSWIGNYSWLIRWGASLGLIPQLDRRGSHAKRPIWALKGSPVFGGRRISISVVDGLLLCCVSRDPEGVRFMVESFDRTLMGRDARARPAESIVDNADESGISELWAGEELDRVWVEGMKPISSAPVTIAVSGLGSNSVGGSLSVEYVLPSASGLTHGALGGLGRVLGDVPEVLAIVPSQYVEDYAEFCTQAGMPAAPGWWDILADSLATNAAGDEQRHVFVCMLGGEYRGRIRSIYSADHDARLRERGLAVPSFMLGVQVGDGDGAAGLITAAVDAINRRYSTGVIERRIAVGDLDVVVFEGTVKSWYSSFLLEERFAYGVMGDWLVVASNSESLMKLVARYQRGEATSQAESGRWLARLRECAAGSKDDPAQAFLWTDFGDSSATIRDGLAVWSMKLVGDRRAAQTRARLKVAQKFVGCLEHLESVRAWVLPMDAGTEARFVLGQ